MADETQHEHLHLDKLDEVAAHARGKAVDAMHDLSLNERLYVSLASNNSHSLYMMNYSIAGALVAIGSEWAMELAIRWGNPKVFKQG